MNKYALGTILGSALIGINKKKGNKNTENNTLLHHISTIIKSNQELNATYSSWLFDWCDGDRKEVQENYEDNGYLETFLEEEFSITIEDQKNAITIDNPHYTNVYSKFFEHLPHLFYHGTTSSFVDDIKNQGLKPNQKTGNHSWPDSSNAVFLTIDRLDAYNIYATKAVQKYGGEPSIIEIALPLTSVTTDHDDADLSSGWKQFMIERINPQTIVDIY